MTSPLSWCDDVEVGPTDTAEVVVEVLIKMKGLAGDDGYNGGECVDGEDY